MNFISREPINKGWSGDKKYCARDSEGRKYLLRVSPAEQYERKRCEYELMRRVAALGIPMCLPLEFGTSGEGVHSVQSWIDGTDAEEIIPGLTPKEQYSYGSEAGRILKKIHTIPAPDGAEDWETFFNRKLDRKIRMYEECPLKYENGQAFIDYINAHRQLLEGRPRSYQHGDYHIGNMMIGRDKKLYIIDFNRCDHGDPWEEFRSIDLADRNGDGDSDMAMLFELDGQQVLMVWFWDAEAEGFVFQPEESSVEDFGGESVSHVGFEGTWYLDGDETEESVIIIGVVGDWVLYDQQGDTRTAIDSGLLRVVDETQGHYAADSEQFDGVSYIIATAGDNGMYWGVTGDYNYYERLD